MMITKKYYYSLFLILILGITCASQLHAEDSDVYQEKVYLHLGRTYLNAGETVRYTAHMASNLTPATNVLSKVLYVQLINSEQRSILEQVLELNGNTSGAILNIPDTLSTGLYELKAYTSWMKNFGDASFFSKPVYIFNQYDDKDAESLNTITDRLLPEIYIQQGKLIAEIPTEVVVGLPEFYSSMKAAAVEKNSGTIASNFELNSGYGSTSFTPVNGGDYAIRLGDSISGYQFFNLPETQTTGYAINVLAIEKHALEMCIYEHNVVRQDLQVLATGSGKEVSLKLPEFKDSINISLALPAELRGVVNLSLLASGNKKLVTQTLVIENATTRFEENTFFATRDKIQIPVSEFTSPYKGIQNLSVSVQKTPPYRIPENSFEVRSLNSYAWKQLDNQVRILLPRFEKKQLTSYSFDAEYKYPVEDLGILLSGKLLNKETQKPQPEIDVVLAVYDTIAQIIAGQTDENGEFVLLLNRTNNTPGIISLYKNGERYKGDVKLILDPNFYYAGKNLNLPNSQIRLSSTFQDEMKEEAQRMLIQRAFEHTQAVNENLPVDTTQRNNFYGAPELVVRPSEFFFLPNFEEIAREITPRVRFKKNDKVCELMVIDVDNHLNSTTPIAIVDGIPVSNYCDLSALNSDDIERIEVQSGARISGNLLYNGLLAIYTSEAYKSKQRNQSARGDLMVPGYSNLIDNYEWHIDTKQLSDNSIPDFENQLYYNSGFKGKNTDSTVLEFYTSDEEGMYTLDMMGVDSDGLPVHIQRHFFVKAKLTAQQ